MRQKMLMQQKMKILEKKRKQIEEEGEKSLTKNSEIIIKILNRSYYFKSNV